MKRGSVTIGLKEFYYIHWTTPYKNGLKLYHKEFYYSEGYKIMTIDACSIETYIDETTAAFGILINTVSFSNLNNKGSKK